MRRTLVPLLIVALVLGVAPASSAGPEPTWSRWSRATLHGLDTGPSGTVVVAGNTHEGYPGGKVVLMHLRRNGDLASRSAWSPKDGRARVSDLSVFRNAYTTGVVSPEVASGGCEEIGSFGWFVRRSGLDGDQRWVRTLRGWRRCTNVSSGAIGAGPGVVAIGTTVHIEGYTDVHGRILAFDPAGDLAWENPFEPFEVGGPEGYDADDVNALAVDAMGRTYAAGWAWRYPREIGADHEAVLMALDRNGGERWVRVLGEPRQPRDDHDRGTDVDVRGSRVLFGAIMDRNDRTSVAKVVMYDAGGRARWAAAFPAAGVWSNHVEVAIGANGVAYVATFRPRTADGDDVVIRKLASGGAVRWTISMPRSRGLRDLAVGDGGLFVLTRHHVWRFPA